MTRYSLWTIVLFVGCKNPLMGQWEGECSVKVGQDVRTHALEFDIEKIDKEDIDGTGQLIEDRTAEGVDEKVWDGVLQGTREKKNVYLTLILDADDLELDGERSGTTIKGDCEWGSNKGDFEVDRVD